VREYFKDVDIAHPPPEIQVHTIFDVDHGRQERRFYGITGDIAWLVERHPLWKSIKSIGMVVSYRTIDEKTTEEVRYYLSSLPADS
jgi:hypothetical protein